MDDAELMAHKLVAAEREAEELKIEVRKLRTTLNAVKLEAARLKDVHRPRAWVHRDVLNKILEGEIR